MSGSFLIRFQAKDGSMEQEFSESYLFGNLINSLISQLVERGLVFVDELYKAKAIPRYDLGFVSGREYIDTNLDAYYIDKRPGWDSPQQKRGEPLSYFSIAIATTPRNFVYQKDYSIEMIKDLLPNAFAQISSISSWEVFAHYTDSTLPQHDVKFLAIEIIPNALGANFSIETDADAPLEDPIEIILDEDIKGLPTQAPPSGSITEYGNREDGDIDLYINKNVFDSLQSDATNSSPYTSGGILIGQAFYQPRISELSIHVIARISSLDAGASLPGLWNKPEIWNTMLQMRDQKFPEAQIIGWYQCRYGESFSDDDEFIYQNFFKAPWQIALLYDRLRDTWSFRQHKGGKDVRCNGFRIVG